MSSFSCIKLVSCQTQASVFVSTFSNSELDTLLQNQLGNVVVITDPANFPDIYYTVESWCSSFQSTPGSSCEECFANAVSLDVTYVIGTNSPQCPDVLAFVLVNCKAGDITIGDPADLIQSPETVLVTSSDLTLYVGSVVNLEEYPDNCYQVLGPFIENTGCPCEYYTVKDAHKDCECCLPPEPEVFTRTTQKPVKVYYHITDTECEIKINEKFANNYYKVFQGLKYGVANCCDNVDLDKLWIEKELSDYSRINPPGVCVIVTPTIVIEDCPITPVLTCGIPTDVSGQGQLT